MRYGRIDDNQIAIVKALRKKWSDDELVWLERNYSSTGLKQSAQHFGRTLGSVRYRASVMGLKINRSSDFMAKGRKSAAKKNAARYLKNATIKTCWNCGGEFRVKKSHEDKTTYCSTECMAEDYKTRLTGKNNPNYGNKDKRTCQQCGEEYKSYVKTRKYCSRLCYNKTRPKKQNRYRKWSPKASKHCSGQGKKDHNHDEIVGHFEKLGGRVQDMHKVGNGFPDILVWCRQKWVLVEIKNPQTEYGRSGLSTNQKLWAEWWSGGLVFVVRTVDDVINLMRGNEDDVESFGR